MKTVLSLTLAALALSGSAMAAEPFVVEAAQDRLGDAVVLFGNSPNRVKVAGADTGGQLAVFEYIGRTRGGPPLHVHPDQDEIFYIRAGEYAFQVGDKHYRLKAGDTIFLPRGVPHTFSQLSAESHMLFMFTPAGDMEAFFREQGALKGVPTPEEGAALFAAHGMKVVGPPLEAK